MSSAAHRFGRVESKKSNSCFCLLQAHIVEKMKTDIQNVQLDELQRTSFLNCSFFLDSEKAKIYPFS